MKNMIRTILLFCLKLFLLLSVVFGIHLAILHFLNFPLFDNQIILAYLINLVLAFLIFGSLVKLKTKYEHLLGFIFMVGSFLKFGVFFLLFYPAFKADGQVNSLEATSFLAPYFTCLIVETYYLIKLMNNKLE